MSDFEDVPASEITDVEAWQVEQIRKGLQEAEAGDFASDEQVRAVFSRWQ